MGRHFSLLSDAVAATPPLVNAKAKSQSQGWDLRSKVESPFFWVLLFSLVVDIHLSSPSSVYCLPSALSPYLPFCSEIRQLVELWREGQDASEASQAMGWAFAF